MSGVWENSFIANDGGATSREFCDILNIVQANILAATADQKHRNNLFNFAVGNTSSVNNSYYLIQNALA